MTHSFNRRQLIFALAAALVAPTVVRTAAAADKDTPKKVLFFTKSSGFPHSVVKRDGDELSHAEKILIKIGKAHGIEVVASKDGGMFDSDKIGQFDAFVFYTTGNLTQAGTDGTPPISPQGMKNLYNAVKDGKGFMGFHCATDTFGQHRKQGADDPYIHMIGGHFAGHGPQQVATIEIVDPAFPGAKSFGPSGTFTLNDEWYAQKNLADDLHVVYAIETSGMKGNDYARPTFPQAWARMEGKGRVFYNSMGHREDVWTNPKFQQMTIAALDWITGRVDADVTPNVTKATPGYKELPKPEVKKAEPKKSEAKKK
jgi:type 1 glutamine amidotransferase